MRWGEDRREQNTTEEDRTEQKREMDVVMVGNMKERDRFEDLRGKFRIIPK